MKILSRFFQPIRLVALLLILSTAVVSFQILPAAEATIKYGDVNGDTDINAADALMVLQAAVDKITLTADQFAAGNVDASQKLDAKDALLILQYAVDKIKTFPAEELATMTPEEQFYYKLDQQYKVNYSDFDDITTIEDINNAGEVVDALGGEPKRADVESYESTEDGSFLSYTPLSNEAKRLGQTLKYNSAPAVKGTLKLGSTVVEYSLPTQMTAYDAVPITYSIYSNEIERVHFEATAFEDPDRYENSNTAYYDCNLPGEVAVELTYEGYVNGYDNNDNPLLNPDTATDKQGVAYPAFDTTEIQKSGTIQSGANYTWFKFSYQNTGDTILDGEGNSTFRFAPHLYKLVDGEWTWISDNPNWYYPLLDYVYPGETGEFWILFNAAGGTVGKFGFEPGEYRIVINGMMRNEQENYSFQHMQVAGKPMTTATFDFAVTEEGGMTAPSAVKNESVGLSERNGWLKNFEEFMSSYTTIEYDAVGKTQATATKGTMYVQPAPWTNQIVLKVIHGNKAEMQRICIPVTVETDSISITLNPYNDNYVIKEDGTRTPMVMTQNMTDMRGHIDRGPYCDDIIVNEIRNIQEAGINTITTTHAFTGSYSGVYDMTEFMLDLARKMGMNYEGHALYSYRNNAAVSRVRAFDRTVDLGSRKDMFGMTAIDAAQGILARWNLIRYGDFYVYDKTTGEIPISIEENYGWMTFNLNTRAGISEYSDGLLQQWLKKAYNNDIDALNQKYNASYTSFEDISVLEQTINGNELVGEVYYDWTAAAVEYDLFRTVERVNNYQDTLKYLNVNNAKVYLRSENAVFLAPGISQTTDNARYRHVYYEQRRSALVPEILAASDIVYGDSSYCWIPFYPSEVYELTRQAAKIGFTTAKTPSFNHMQDVAVINDAAGKFDYSDKLALETYQMGCSIGVNSSLFTWCKAIYEAGGVPGTMWMDYACDLYVTSTQYKELQFLNQKIQEMLATDEGKAWANSVPESAKTNPVADLATGGYSFPEAYVEEKLATTPRYNQILDYCNKN